MKRFRTAHQNTSVCFHRFLCFILIAGFSVLSLLSCENELIGEIDSLRSSAISPTIDLSYGTDTAISLDGDYDFNLVSVGGSNEIIFNIKNSGNSTLSIDLIGLTLANGADTEDGTFSISANPAADVSVGESSTFTMNFSPKSKGEKSATVTIPTNDYNTPAFSFTLSGEGWEVILDTVDISGIGENTATSGGSITDAGGGEITDRGICWSTSPYPTITDSFASDGGQGTGSYSTQMKNLSCDTYYYVRAYASNAVSTGYGPQVSFRTMPEAAYNITATAVPYADGSGKLEVAWESSNSSATVYDVYYRELTNDPPAAPGLSDLAASSCVLEGLINYSEYFIWVIARNISGSSSFSVAGSGTVGYKVESITVSGKYIYFLPGMTEQLTVEISPETATDTTLNWSSSNGNVSVADGLVTGVANGTGSAIITATAADGSGKTGNYDVQTKSFAVNAASPSGGYLFYDNGSYTADGWRYLEYAGTSATIAGIQWASYGFETDKIYGALYTELGTGKANTDAILESLGENAPMAYYCRNFSLGGFTDWYMPSLDEVKGFVAIESYFWDQTMASSTQSGTANAFYAYYYATSATQSYYKYSTYCKTVPVRRF